MSEEPKWRKARGDGTDRLPLGTWYEGLRRDGRIERDLCITEWCLKPGPNPFRNTGKPWDIVAIRIVGEP